MAKFEKTFRENHNLAGPGWYSPGNLLIEKFPERKGWTRASVLEPGGAPGGHILLQTAHHDDRQRGVEDVES